MIDQENQSNIHNQLVGSLYQTNLKSGYFTEFFKRITGFDEDSSSFINLIESTEECQYNALNAFCGPSDSRVYPFLLEKEMHEKDIKSLDGKEIGPDTHLHIVPFDEYPQYVYDGVSTAPLAVIDHSKKD